MAVDNIGSANEKMVNGEVDSVRKTSSTYCTEKL
jgi:hypothetical protein